MASDAPPPAPSGRPTALAARLDRHAGATALLAGLLLIAVWVGIWGGLLPNARGWVGVDYSLWLPDMLAGYFWHLTNGVFSLPWFSPGECGGLPFYADPQVAVFSLPQALTLLMPPLAAVRLSILLFLAAGWGGAWALARGAFGLPLAPALLAATLWLFNGMMPARMAMGHFTYAPFMLAPALAACLLPRGPEPLPRAVLRVLAAGALIGLMLHAGMVHGVPPLMLSVALVVVMHALWHGPAWRPVALLAGGTLLGACLAAGKLVAGLALLRHLPRDLYPLPGLPAPFTLLATALQALFWTVDTDLGRAVVNTHLIQDQTEFSYGVTPLPAVLLAAWAWTGLRAGRRPTGRRSALAWALACALAALAAMPLALNAYAPGWNALLKALPFIGNSSTLLRWFSAWMLPLALAAGLAAARLPALSRRAPLLAAGGAALAILFAVLTPKTIWGPQQAGFYDARAIDQAWAEAHARGAPPPITVVNALVDDTGAGGLSPMRQNGLTQGISELYCYQPLFGYRLERYPIRDLWLGSVVEKKGDHLNMKNPACYVWPEANQCEPGEHFAATRVDDVLAFAAWRPFPFRMPPGARLANWLSLVTLLAMALAAPLAAWRAAAGRRVRAA